MNKTALFRISVCTLILSLVIGCIIPLPYVFHISLSSDNEGILQIFYAGKGAITEKDSVKAYYHCGKNRLNIEIPIQPRLKTIRLDPSFKSGQNITITKIVCDTGFQRYTILFQDMKILSEAGISHTKNGFITMTEDPQILWDFKTFCRTAKKSVHLSKPLWKRILFASFAGIFLSGILFLLFAEKQEREKIRKKLRRISVFMQISSLKYCIWGLIFLLMFLFGFTFSNLGILKSPLIKLDGERKVLGSYKMIRSDEYAAHGVLPAIQQMHQNPKFPLCNKSVGLTGRNYLTLHDTGCPVRHISMLSRPAVWGFFLFDLRHALSWLSLFPVFFSVFSFWFLFDTLWKRNPLFNFLAAFTCVYTTTSSVWSFWPAFNAAGLMLGSAAFIHLLKENRKWAVFLWGLLMGWSFSVSALTIYFPRIWFSVNLLLVVITGMMFDRRMWRNLYDPVRVAAVILGFFLCAGLILPFFSSAKEAIELTLNSVYPGKRVCQGGGMYLWQLLFGWIAPLSMGTATAYPFGSECDLQEPLFLMLPLFLCSVFLWKKMRDKCIVSGIFLLISGFYCFYFFKIPVWLTKITLWSRCTEIRADYFLALGQIFLLCTLFSRSNCNQLADFRKKTPFRKILFLFLTFCAVFLPLLTLYRIPRIMLDLLLKSPDRTILYIIFSVYAVIALMLFFNFRFAAICFLFVDLYWGISYNPLCIAPEKISSELLQKINSEKSMWKHEGRVLFISTLAEGNLYAAAGGKILNGFFAYEDTKIFDLLLKDQPDPKRFHRLNHMIANITSENAPYFRAVIPQLDVIQLEFNGSRYCFTELPIDYVLVKDPEAIKLLNQNRSLVQIDSFGNWKRYRIFHDERK